MESRSSFHQNKPNSHDKTESRSKNQRQAATVPPGVRAGNGSFQIKKGGKSVDSSMQSKAPTSTVTPSTSTTLAPASVTASHVTSKTAQSSILNAATTASLITSSSKIPDKHVVGMTQGTTLTAVTSEQKIKRFTEGELKTSKNVHKPTPHNEERSKEVTPSLKQKCKYNDNEARVMEDSQKAHSLQPEGTKQIKLEVLQRNKDEMNIDRKEEGGIHKDMQVKCTPKGSDITFHVTSKCPPFSLDRAQTSPGATTTSTSQVKETAGKTSENALAQERMSGREKRREWMEGVEEKESHEKIGGTIGKDQEENTEDKREKERKEQERNSEAKEKETKESEKKLNQIFKTFNDSVVMTEDNPVPVRILDAALQTELLCKDAEIQAVVEVSNKSTSMTPNKICPPWSQMHPRSDHENVSGTDCMNLQNGLSQDGSFDSGLEPISLAPVESLAKGLSPSHYKSSTSSKTTQQHVCQIQIELRSQPTVSTSLTVPEEKDSQASSTRSGLEIKSKQVDRDGDKSETDPLPEVAWDEQGMTWEVYGAAVDMESLGFAIQNHLQRKIHEHEQRIRHLRKSVSLSEHSNGDGKRDTKKKKRNVFQTLFQRSSCCLKIESEA